MKASELKIGNLIQWEDESNDIVEVLGIGHCIDGENDLAYKETKNNSPGLAMLSEFIPIVLTEEWLLKFGFVRDLHKISTIYGKCGHTPSGKSTGLIIYQCPNGSYSPAAYNDTHQDIVYVHQLQNLFFALTGEELTIK